MGAEPGPSVGSTAVGGGKSATAVIVDQWPLVRLGLVGVLEGGGVDVVGQAAKVSEGLLLVRLRSVDLVVFGSPLDGLRPSAIRAAKRADNPPRIVVLVPPGTASKVEVGALFVAGADALLVASVGPDELADALARIDGGERVVGLELGPERFDGESRRSGAPPGFLDPPPLLREEDVQGSLTSKECEVVALLALGHSNKQIARALYVSDATVKTHLQHIYTKLGVQNRFGALSRAAELDLLG